MSDCLETFRNTGIEPLPDEAACPVCGWFDVAHPDVQRILRRRDSQGRLNLLYVAQCKCRLVAQEQQAKAGLRAQQANLPHPQTPRTFDNFQARPGTEQMLAAAQRFVERQGPRILVFCGGYGGGKSHLVEAIGRAVLEQGRSVRYEFITDLFVRLRHTYSRPEDQEDLFDVLAWYQRMDTLLLDDNVRANPTDWETEQITSLVDERLRNQRRLALATNDDHQTFLRKLGPRLASRLFQSDPAVDGVQVVPVTARDYRRNP